MRSAEALIGEHLGGDAQQASRCEQTKACAHHPRAVQQSHSAERRQNSLPNREHHGGNKADGQSVARCAPDAIRISCEGCPHAQHGCHNKPTISQADEVREGGVNTLRLGRLKRSGLNPQREIR